MSKQCPAITLHAALVEGLKALDPERHGLISGEIKRRLELDMEAAYQGSREPKHAALIDAMAMDNLISERIVNAARLGKRLQLLKDKRINGQWISATKAHRKVSKWIVCGEATQPSYEK